ncbi:Gmad2 immunoglobulin-like domain-containing protein [Candidatus Parcubacteria bacterium]|nr:Gmad2 immunoglobulin-like domain-containing protein [Candidatus Parcubacteria bacterium]
MKKIIIFLILTFVLIFIGSLILVWRVLPGLISVSKKPSANIENIEEKNASKSGEQNAKDDDTIIVNSPVENDFIESPLTIKGVAPGTWFFEGDFPIVLLDSNGKRIAIGFAQAQGIWTTESMVPFISQLEFVAPVTEDGSIVFSKDNPSGLKHLDERFSISIRFRATTQGAGEPCKLDSECQTPAEFMIRSSCPYESRCINDKCTVVCPHF